MSKEIKIEIDGEGVKAHMGFALVGEGRKMRALGNEKAALELETVGRQMIEESRESEEVNFEDTLFDVE